MTTGANLLCDYLQQAGVEVIFGYPGGAVLPIYDALFDHAITHIVTRHEQGAIHAAQGYARRTGRPGVVLATSGPGASNLLTGIADAYIDSTPVIIITGQVEQAKIGTDAFQEVDTYGITVAMTKHNYQVRNVSKLPEILAQAFYIATTGRQGPVLIDIPKDVASAVLEPIEIKQLPIHLPGYQLPHRPADEQIDQIIALLSSAKRPVIIAGGGVISANASAWLREWVGRSGIPVVSTLMGIGAVAEDEPFYLGMVGMHGTFVANKAIAQADVVLAIGMRFSDRVTGRPGSFAPHAIKIQIDVDESEVGKNIPVDLAVITDARYALEALVAKNITLDLTAWHEQIRDWQAHWSMQSLPEHLHPVDVIQLLGELTKATDPVIVTDVGQHQIFAARFFPHQSPRHFITSGGLGTMGFGLPAAIGAKMAEPNSLVILITGDGSFQMNLREMQTLIENQISVKIVVMNNGYLGMVRQWQDIFLEKRYAESKISSPDFVRLAQAYGLLGLRATNITDAHSIIEQAIAYDGSVVMEFMVQEEANVYPMIPAGESYDAMIVK